MNLELLDPFGRQIPDRIDSTLQLGPSSMHFVRKDVVKEPAASKKTSPSEEQEWKAAYHVAFNRRGTYLAVGYGSGAVAIYNVTSRTLGALYRSHATPQEKHHGVTSVTWSRRSRTLLAGAAGDDTVQLIDTTHPYGQEEACLGLALDHDYLVLDQDEYQTEAYDPNVIQSLHSYTQTHKTSFADEAKFGLVYTRDRSILETSTVRLGQPAPAMKSPQETSPKKLVTAVTWKFSHAVGGSLQVHPRRPTAGLAALINGSLVLFWMPASIWEYHVENAAMVQVVPLWDDTSTHFITCAAFCHTGNRVYCGTKQGAVLGFDVEPIWKALTSNTSRARAIPRVSPQFCITLGTTASAWHLLVSRNGKSLVLNSADGALRLLDTATCWQNPESVTKPKLLFQDVVSKVKFASCDLSGDGEYLVGAANGDDLKYALYVWNTSTGALMDKLTGASVQLYSVAWHPTRSFLAVATSDGLVDIWGPRINWTAFAPDFQALPMNVEFIEREDEFDVDPQGEYLVDKDTKAKSDDNENALVDVTTIEPVPVFASDSEGEDEVFTIKTRVKNLVAGRVKGSKAAANDD